MIDEISIYRLRNDNSELGRELYYLREKYEKLEKENQRLKEEKCARFNFPIDFNECLYCKNKELEKEIHLLKLGAKANE